MDQDTKAKYRKRPVTTKGLHQSEKSLNIYNSLKNLLEKEQARTEPRTEHIAFLKTLLGHAEHGADLVVINKALDTVNDRWRELTGTDDLTFMMADSDEAKEEYFKKRQACPKGAGEKPWSKRNAYLKQKRLIEGALRVLKNIDPVLPTCTAGKAINEKLAKLHRQLEAARKIYSDYLDLRLTEIAIHSSPGKGFGHWPESLTLTEEDIGYDQAANDKFLKLFQSLYPLDRLKRLLDLEPATQATHEIWAKATKLLTKEFDRVYGTKNAAYKHTGDLLSKCFYDLYTNPDRDLVKARLKTATQRKAKRKN